MARVKGGYTTHRRHKKILDSVKGHSGSRLTVLHTENQKRETNDH